MIEIRFHSRGGQGAVVAAKILAVAFFREQKFVQTFPSFGSEVRGAPIVAYTRVHEKPIHRRWNIANPDHLIVLDENLLRMGTILGGLKENGWIVVNSPRSPGELTGEKTRRFSIATVNATSIAYKYGLGSRTTPIVNTAILGAFSRATALLQIESIAEAIRELVPNNPTNNVSALKEAYESTATVSGDIR
jgi:2-oxoisovalerate ferredoxin oxidoreductase gamma subunit